MENQNTQDLIEKIARLLRDNEKSGDETLRASIEKINQRLDKIESQLAFQTPKIRDQKSKINHFSQEKFPSLEEIADEVMNDLQTEKACPYEPTGKPCDHCAMCNSRGF